MFANHVYLNLLPDVIYLVMIIILPGIVSSSVYQVNCVRQINEVNLIQYFRIILPETIVIR